jgi:hypothetical protein
MKERPRIKDEIAWRVMIMNHRRMLFERVLAEFPEIAKSDKVYLWKARLGKSL